MVLINVIKLRIKIETKLRFQEGFKFPIKFLFGPVKFIGLSEMLQKQIIFLFCYVIKQ